MLDGAPRRQGSDIEPQRSAGHGQTSRWTGVLLMLVVAGVISAAAGFLSHAAGNNLPSAILTSGGAFAGSFALLLAIAHYTDTD